MERTCPRATIGQAFALVALALVCAILSNAFSSPARNLRWLGRPPLEDAKSPGVTSVVPAPVSPPASLDPLSADVLLAEPSRPIREIDSETAWKAFGAKVPFVDARRTAEYAEGHIAGAWTLPVWESDVDGRITAFEVAAKLTSKAPLVLYCNGAGCEDSHLLASKLQDRGYRNLLVYRDGFPDWVRQGRPSIKWVQP